MKFTPVCNRTFIRSNGEQINEDIVEPINPEINLIWKFPFLFLLLFIKIMKI